MQEKNPPPGEEETTPLSHLDPHDMPTVTPVGSSRGAKGRAVFETDRIVAGRYRIIRFIARGGMGEVYEAEDLELHGHVALKTIRPEIADDSVSVERFRREIQMARKVTHPNVCRVFDVSHDQTGGGDVIFVTMELLNGQTLAQRIRENGALSPSDALPIARQMGEGLDAAHRAGVIHRDFKSANVMLVPQNGQNEPRVVVTDFGLARASAGAERSVTNTGDIIGSPPYLAPEQIEGKELSPATDIYAFGVVLYEIVTGKYPFVADTPIASVLKRLHEPAPSPRRHVPSLDTGWEGAILRCLERNPADRFPDALSAVRALEGKRAATIPSRRRARARLFAIAFAAVVFAAAVAKWVPWSSHQPIKPLPGRVAPDRRAVAVVGFRNQSGSSDVAWLSTALAEMLTTEVAAGEQVRTIPGETIARMRTDLGLGGAESFSAETLARIRKIVAADYLVSGSYAALGTPGTRSIRLDLQLQEALGGNVVAAVAETGTEDRIFDLVSRAGARLREKLGVAAVTPEAASGILASLPANARAVRFYAEGLTKLRVYDNLAARELFEKAIAEDPEFPLAHAELAGVYSALGYDGKAKQEARTAIARASKLPRESRLLIEAQSHSHSGEFGQAAEIYRALSRFYPDNLDYAMRTIFAEIYAGNGKEALATIDSLRKTWQDPRLDVAEAEAAESISDYKRCRAAALRAARTADERGQRLLAARAHLFEGWALLRMSDPVGARAAFEDARQRYEKAGDRSGAGQALGGIGAMLLETNQLDEARGIFEAERKIAHETGSRSGEAADLHNIAMVLNKKGDLRGAKAALRQAVALERETGNKGGLAGTLDMLGSVELSAGNLSEAARLFEQALAINEEIDAVRGAANNRNNLAIIQKARGNLSAAEQLLQQAVAGYRQTHDEAAAADTLNNLAVIQRTRGDLAAAEKSYKEAEQVYTRLNSQTDLAMVAVNVGALLTERGDLAGARQKNEKALAIWRSTGEKSYAAYAVMGIGEVDFRSGDLDAAEKRFREALQSRQQMGEQSTSAESMLALADLFCEKGRLPEADQMARSALAIFQKEQRSDVIAMARSTLCRIAIAARDLGAARQFLRDAQSAEGSDEYALSLTEAKLALASGKPTLAVKQLSDLVDKTTRKGVVMMQMEARLALAEARIAAGQVERARSELESLEWDATKKGFGLVARKAAQLRQKAAG